VGVAGREKPRCRKEAQKWPELVDRSATHFFSDAVIFRQLKIPKDYQNPALIIRAKMKAISQQLDVYSVASTNTSWLPD